MSSPQEHDKDVIVLEPHPHHTLLASFGEDTAETEENIVNTHMWCECRDTVWYHSSGLRAFDYYRTAEIV